jgi:hypothetical protein
MPPPPFNEPTSAPAVSGTYTAESITTYQIGADPASWRGLDAGAAVQDVLDLLAFDGKTLMAGERDGLAVDRQRRELSLAWRAQIHIDAGSDVAILWLEAVPHQALAGRSPLLDWAYVELREGGRHGVARIGKKQAILRSDW